MITYHVNEKQTFKFVQKNNCHPVLQIRRGNMVNLGHDYRYFSKKTLFCYPSLELSHKDGSDEDHNICFN